jgi:hypothetical protein
MAAPSPTLHAAQWRQLGLISLAAIALFYGLRALPTGTNLNHMDFRVAPGGANAIEFCDPSNPQFIPVVAVRSPVVMGIRTEGTVRSGEPARVVATFKTASGKPLAPEDLLVTHTRRMHLLIVDPSLGDYQHLHPLPGREPGEWVFEFTPHAGGTYRVFADFTPAATGRGLYASADLPVVGDRGAGVDQPAADLKAATTIERGGVHYSLNPATGSMRAGEPVELKFAMSGVDGGEVRLEPVMDAFAHLVAFDETRSGFAHLHPAESDVSKALDAKNPVLNFRLTIPQPGRYVIWAQVKLAGQEQFVPFWFNVGI